MIKKFFREEEDFTLVEKNSSEEMIEVIFTPEVAEEEDSEKMVLPRRIEKKAISNVYRREAPNGRKKGILRKGSSVTIVAEKDGWSETSQGLYVRSDFLEE